MGDRLKYERFFWFHRDRLNAPLQYDTAKRGYFYDNDSYELPPLWLNEDNIIALSLAVRLASSIPDTGIKPSRRGVD